MKYKRNRPYRLLSYKPIEEADNLIIIGLFDVSGKRDWGSGWMQIEVNKLIVCNIYAFVPYSANGRFGGLEHRKAGVRLTNR